MGVGRISCFLSLFISILFLQSCIGDDFIDDEIDPEIRITTQVDTLEIGTAFQFEAMYLNKIGMPENVAIEWSSQNSEIIDITSDGLANALTLGSTSIIASYDSGEVLFLDTLNVAVGETTVIETLVGSGEIQTTSFYDLEGDFTISDTEKGILIDIKDNYLASTGLPGFYLYLTNNKNSVNGAFEVSMITVFEGAHQYEVEGVSLNDYSYLLFYCKPFNVKVGDAEWSF